MTTLSEPRCTSVRRSLKPSRSSCSHGTPGSARDRALADAAVARDEPEAELAEVARLDGADLARDEVVVEEVHGARIVPARLGRAPRHCETCSSPSDLTSWNLAPLQLLPTVLLSFAYFRRTRTLARRGQPVAGWRQFLFWLGIFLLVLAINSPIDDARRDRLLLRPHDPAHPARRPRAALLRRRPDGPGAAARARDPAVRQAARAHAPLVALPVWAVNLYVWHVPFLYQAALHHSAVHALEHILFFTCGALMWSPVVETLPQPAWFGTGWKLGYVAIVRLIETVLGNVFIWSSPPSTRGTSSALPKWGIDAVHDQNLAGRRDDGRGLARHARRCSRGCS